MAKKRPLTKQQLQAQQRSAYQMALKKKSFTLPKTDKKIVLSLGHSSAIAGRLHRQFSPEQWYEIRMDADARTNPDIIAPITSLEMLDNDSIDGVWIGHVLHRFSYNDARTIMLEVMRVMKDGGTLLAAVPDIQLPSIYIANNDVDTPLYHAPAGDVSAIDLIYGFQRAIAAGDTSRRHLSGYTAESFGMFLREAGACNLHLQRDRFDVYALGTKLPYEHPDRVERIVLKRDNSQHPKAPPKEQAAISQSAVRYADRLEDEPQMWTPLGLKT